jgi:hypothetical protein
MLVSFEQGLALVLNGIGQAMMANNSALEGPAWMDSFSLLLNEPLKVARTLLALQITLVSVRRWHLLLHLVTLLSTVYFSILAAVLFRNYPNISYISLSGPLLMLIGSFLFGFGSHRQHRRSHRSLKKFRESFGESQNSKFGRSLSTKEPDPCDRVLYTHHSSRKLDKPKSISKSPFDEIPATHTLNLATAIELPAAPTAELAAKVALKVRPSSSLPHNISTGRVSKEGSGRGSAALTNSTILPGIDRVASAFQKDPYKIDLAELSTNVYGDEYQVFTPGYFEAGKPTHVPNKKRAPSSSSSREIIEEEGEGEPYSLYYSDE